MKANFQNCTEMKLSIKDFFSKCDQIRRKLQICWSHLLRKFFMVNFFVNASFCFVSVKEDGVYMYP